MEWGGYGGVARFILRNQTCNDELWLCLLGTDVCIMIRLLGGESRSQSHVDRSLYYSSFKRVFYIPNFPC